jgi:DTW domain-containing protein
MRSVVLKASRRCPQCHLAPRWCICSAHRPIACPLAIDVLLHHREQHRPSSTGRLINRVIPASRQHVWRRERKLNANDIRVAGRELWILHPQGELLPTDVSPECVQIVLLDGSWRETTAIAQELRGWGRMINLPMSGASRYRLRTQGDAGRFSTVEALLFLLRSFGLSEAHAALRAQFELHVYASLRARGHKPEAELFLADSPVGQMFPELIAELNVRRPCDSPVHANPLTAATAEIQPDEPVDHDVS